MKRKHTQKKSARRGKIKPSMNIIGGRWFWKSKFVIPIDKVMDKNYKKPPSAQSNGTYVRPKRREPINH